MSADLILFIHGAATLACLLVGVKFLKFWRASRDRFFLWFAAAFWVFATEWILRDFAGRTTEHVHKLDPAQGEYHQQLP